MTKNIFLCLFSALVCFQITAPAQKKNRPPNVTNVSLQRVNVIKEGVGIEGIVVGKSTMKDVEKKFGKNYNWAAHKKYSYSMSYPKLGLTFYMCQTDKRREIFDIEIKQPYMAKTSKGIILGKSTVEDIYRIYGKSRGGGVGASKESLEFRGVNFYYNFIGGKKIVTIIDIVENSGIRQCVENK